MIRSFSLHKGTTSGETIYFGSPQSQTLLRVYDKRLELLAKKRPVAGGLRHSMGIGIQTGPRAALWPSR